MATIKKAKKKEINPKSKKKVKKNANIGQRPQNAPVDWYGQGIINVLPGHP